MNEPLSSEAIDLLVANLKKLNPDQLGSLDHDTLYRMRSRASKEDQAVLAPFEHRAFAREETAQNPVMALPLGLAIPAYQPYKALRGLARSPASMDQVTQGYKGVGEGLWAAFQDGMRSIRGLPTGTGTTTSATALLESLRSYPQGSSTASMNRLLPTRPLASR